MRTTTYSHVKKNGIDVPIKPPGNPHWIELPLSATNFHGPKGVRATEVRLYVQKQTSNWL